MADAGIDGAVADLSVVGSAEAAGAAATAPSATAAVPDSSAADPPSAPTVPKYKNPQMRPPEWIDITQLVTDAAAELDCGELVHADDFSLHASLSATELMHPKLDARMNRKPNPSVAERVKAGTLSLGCSPRDATLVLDHLFDLEMSWQAGNSLPQTLYVCMYIQADTLRLLQQVTCNASRVTGAGGAGAGAGGADGASSTPELRPTLAEAGIEAPFAAGSREHTVALSLLAYCATTARMVQFVQALCVKADVYEEEDFYNQMFGLDLRPDLTDDDLEAMLVRAEQAVLVAAGSGFKDAGTGDRAAKRKRKRRKAGVAVPMNAAPVTRESIKGVEAVALDDDEATNHQLCSALLARLRMRRSFYATLQHMVIPGAAGFDDAKAALAVLRTQYAELAAFRDANPRSVDNLKSMNLDSAAHPRADEAALAPGAAVAPGFDPSFHRMLISPHVPRMVRIMAASEAYTHFGNLLGELDTVAQLREQLAAATSHSAVAATAATPPAGGAKKGRGRRRGAGGSGAGASADASPPRLRVIIDFLEANSLGCPHVIPRSVLTIAVRGDTKVLGGHTYALAVQADLRAHGIPAPVLKHPSVQEFMAVAARSMLDYLRFFGWNISRQQRKVDILLADWFDLQAQADMLDVNLSSLLGIPDTEYIHRIGAWTQDYLLRLQHLYLLHGFRLQLYSADELDTTYWYMLHVANDLHANWKGCLYSSFMAKEEERQQRKNPKGGKGGKKGKNMTKLARNRLKKNPPTSWLLQVYKIDSYVARGIFNLLTALRLLGRLQQPAISHRNPEVVFNHRFGIFDGGARPQFATFSDFTRDRRAHEDQGADALLKQVGDCLRMASTLAETVLSTPATTFDVPMPDRVRQQLQSIRRVCVTNSVLAARLRAAGADDAGDAKDWKRWVRFNFETHAYFPTVRMPEKKPAGASAAAGAGAGAGAGDAAGGSTAEATPEPVGDKRESGIPGPYLMVDKGNTVESKVWIS